MTPMKAQARFIMVSRFTDNGAYSHCALVDSTTGRELGCDGGEPEDQLLTRDWAWVADELNSLAAALTAAYERGRTEQREVDAKLAESLSFTKELLKDFIEWNACNEKEHEVYRCNQCHTESTFDDERMCLCVGDQ